MKGKAVVTCCKNVLSKLKKINFFFLILVSFEALILMYLIRSHRMVIGHDGFQYFQLQYYFLNNAVQSGEIPQWLPFLTHGTVSAWWYVIQGGILQNVFLAIAKIFSPFQHGNFLPVFYASMFFDEVVLLVGVWLLGKRYFSSVYTNFLVSSAIVGSCIWMTQVWWNFHLYYAIPLVIYLLHVFIDTAKWRYCLLALNLLVLQNLGNLPYFFPVALLTVFVYFFYFLIFNFRDIRPSIEKIKFNPHGIFCCLFTFACLVGIYFTTKLGTESITNYNFGRTAGSGSSLNDFLSYGGNLDWNKWLESVIGVSPSLDYTLYFGFLPLMLLFLGIKSALRRSNIHLLLTAVTLLLFSMGTVVSVFFYHYWPFMNFFRHLALISPLTKIFLCFLAGLGFESVLNQKESSAAGKKNMYGRMIVIALSFSLSIILLYIAGHPSLAQRLAEHMIQVGVFITDYNQRIFYQPGLPVFLPAFGSENLFLQLCRTAFFMGFIAVALFWVWPSFRQKEKFGQAIAILILLHTLDVFSYKLLMVKLRTIPLNTDYYNMLNFQKIPFMVKRNPSGDFNVPAHDRKLMGSLINVSGGQQSWAFNLFYFNDEIGGTVRTDHWLFPLDRLMRAYWKQPLTDLFVQPAGVVPYIRLDFPLKHVAAGKVSGLTEDKIQFFSRAKIYDDDNQIASHLTDPQYTGNGLFLSDFDDKTGLQHISQDAGRMPLTSAQLHLPYKIIKFDSNNIKISVNSPSKAWLYYADVWHPFWKAKVNGYKRPVFRANLAYKAVELDSGNNVVSFYFQSPLMTFLQRFFALNSVFWVGVIIWMVFGMITEKHDRQKKEDGASY